MLRRPRAIVVRPDRRKRAGVVEPEIARVVVALGERDALGGEHALIRGEVQRFAVGDHAVEIEDDRTQRQS